MQPTSDLRTTALRTDLLEQQYVCNTKWCVVTGAPSSGKTSVLETLERKNFRRHPEVARTYIEKQQSQGRGLADIRSDEALFQRTLIDTKLQMEADTPSSELVFFDRGMPDSITYYRIAGLDPNEALANCFRFRYSAVFIFDCLPLVCDHTRTEGDQKIKFLDLWLEQDYKALGYTVTRVPVMSIANRVEFILDKLQAQGVL